MSFYIGHGLIVLSALVAAGGKLATASTLRAVDASSEVKPAVYEDSNVFARLGRIGGDSLILIPGGEVAAKRYVGLAEEIVSQDPDVSVFVARFTKDYVTPWEVGPKVKASLAVMQRLGWREPASSAYLVGHSMGGLFAHSEVGSSKLKGLILLASYLPQAALGGAPYNVSTFSKPILVLGGEWDRRVDIHVQSRAFADFTNWLKSHPDDPSKVVGVLPGASHMQFADGDLLASDVAGTRSAVDVRREVAKIITAFLRQQDPQRRNPRDQQVLDDVVEKSKPVFAPVYAAGEMDKAACSWLQSRMAPTVRDRGAPVADTYGSYGGFALARPQVGTDGALGVPTHLELPPNPFDLPGTPFGIPVALSCKLTLPRGQGAVGASASTRCQEADRLLSESVRDSLTAEQQDRVESSQSQAVFSSQKVSSWAQWLVTPTGFRNKGDVTKWESHSVVWVEASGQNDVLTCKLTPPTRWLFYYLRDAHLTSLENAVRL